MTDIQTERKIVDDRPGLLVNLGLAGLLFLQLIAQLIFYMNLTLLVPSAWIGLFNWKTLQQIVEKKIPGNQLSTESSSQAAIYTGDLIFIGVAISLIITICLLIYFLRYLFETERIPADKKLVWAVCLLMGYPLAMPVFYLLYFLQKPEQPDKSSENP